MNIGDGLEGMAFETVVQWVISGVGDSPDEIVDGGRRGAEAEAQRHDQTQTHPRMMLLRADGKSIVETEMEVREIDPAVNESYL